MKAFLKSHSEAALLWFAGVVIVLDLANMTPWALDEALLFGCVWLMKKIRSI